MICHDKEERIQELKKRKLLQFHLITCCSGTCRRALGTVLGTQFQRQLRGGAQCIVLGSLPSTYTGSFPKSPPLMMLVLPCFSCSSFRAVSRAAFWNMHGGEGIDDADDVSCRMMLAV
eukprot:1147995-Pelagomonas_calceolata.AAC.9